MSRPQHMSLARPCAGLVAALLIGAGAPAVGAALQALVKDQHGKPVADAVVLATPLDAKNALHARPP